MLGVSLQGKGERNINYGGSLPFSLSFSLALGYTAAKNILGKEKKFLSFLLFLPPMPQGSPFSFSLFFFPPLSPLSFLSKVNTGKRSLCT